MDKTAQNTFTKGMALDNNQYIALNSTMRSCLNGTLFTLGDKENVLQNDLGNGKFGYVDTNGTTNYVQLKQDYIPLKTKEHNGILYILSKNFKTGQEEIGSIPSPQYAETKDVQADQIAVSPISTRATVQVYTEDKLQVSQDDVTMTINKDYDIHFWDLNNTRVPNSKQNKLGEVSAVFQDYEGKQINLTSKFKNLIKTDYLNNSIYSAHQLKEKVDIIDSIPNYGKIEMNFKAFNDDQFRISASVDYDRPIIKDNFQFINTKTGKATIKISYNCPDGNPIKGNFNLSNIVDKDYNYQSGAREVNFFSSVRLYKYDLHGNPIKKNDQQQFLDITNNLDSYTYDDSKKLFTQKFTQDYSNLTGYSWELKTIGKKFENSTTANWVSCSDNGRFSIDHIIELNNYNDPKNKKYNKFFWTKADYDKILGVYNTSSNKYEMRSLHYQNKQQVIWNLTNNTQSVLVFYDLDDDTKTTGQIIRPSIQVGNEIYGENNEIYGSGRFRYLYELNDINKDHNYIILEVSSALDLEDKTPKITDVQYYFPKINSTYLTDSSTVIPNSILGNTSTVQPSDALGGYIQTDIQTPFTPDNYGTNLKAAVFGQSMSDTSRVWGFKPVDNPDYPQAGFITGVTHGLEISSSTDINKTLTFGMYSKNNQSLFTDTYNLNLLIRSSSSVDEEQYSCMIDYINIYKLNHSGHGDVYDTEYINGLDDLPAYSSFKYEQLGDKLIQDDYHYDINTDSINNISDSEATSDLQIEDGRYYLKTNGRKITGLIIEPSTRHYSQVNISTSLFTKQNPRYETITLSFSTSDGSFKIGSKKVTDLKQYLRNNYLKYAKDGCFIKLTLDSSIEETNYANHELFIYKDDNRDFLVTYFPISEANVSVMSTKYDRYIKTNIRNFTSKLTLLDYPELKEVPKVSRQININIGSSIEDQIKYKNQKWLGSNGVLETRMRQWNFPDKIKDVVNGVNNPETKIFDFKTSGSSITVDEYNNLRVYTNLKYRTLVNDIDHSVEVEGTSYYTGFDNGSYGMLYYDPSTNRLIPVLNIELNRDVCKIVDFKDESPIKSYNNSELTGVTNPNYVIWKQVKPTKTYQFKAKSYNRVLNVSPDFVVDNVSTQNPQFEIL